MENMPWLPVEEEGRLKDPSLRENFIERVFLLHRWQTFFNDSFTAAALVEFHTRHKYTLMAHSGKAYSELGRMVAEAGNHDLQEFSNKYIEQLMSAMSKIATRKTHTNVLMHIMGYFKKHMDADDKKELLEVFERYRLGQIPLIVPITLIKHYLRRFPDQYVLQQYYLQPHPDELMLRNSL